MALRANSHNHASTSSRCSMPAVAGARSRRARLQVTGALFEPPPFQPQKLSVEYLPGARTTASFPPPSRRYTLTHNDITGALQLSIGSDYNQRQVQGFYTRILRDEITAEWYFAAGAPAPAELHIYCHVSGEEKWLAPPQLRNFIFRREMTLVLDTFAYADSDFLQSDPELQRAKVYVHFQSDVQDLDLREYWGLLGDRTSWRRMPRGVLARFKLLLFGFPAVPHQRPRTSLTAQQQQRRQQQQQQQVEGPDQPRMVPVAAAAATADVVGMVLQQQQQQKPSPLLPLPLPPQAQQQQQWPPQAAAAIEATRPVALSLQQEQLRLHPVAASSAQPALPLAATNSSSDSSSSSSSSSRGTRGPGSRGSSSSNGNGTRVAAAPVSGVISQDETDDSGAVQSCVEGQEPAGRASSSSSQIGCNSAASILVPVVSNQLQAVLQQQQQQQRVLGIRPLVVAAASSRQDRI